MRLILFVVLALVKTISCAQTSLNEIDLKLGEYTVGFKHYTIVDSTRTYSRVYDYSNQKVLRPIPVSIWYPSNQNTEGIQPLQILDYFTILKEEEEWEHLPNEQLLNWFEYANTKQNRIHLLETTNAFSELKFANNKFPVIVYAPSHQASSIENFALCEYLTSHGYIVISSPSRGTETRWFSNNPVKEIENQARDVEFLMKEVGKLPIADFNNIALMGFSFGGLANVIAQNRNEHVKAMVSLDGTERYQYGLLNRSAFFNPEKIDVPYIHMAQKDIPEKVLAEDDINPELNVKFELFDSISKSEAYQLKFHHLTHSYFSTLGVLFAKRDKRQDKNDSQIMESYKWVSIYGLNFLNAFLKKDQEASSFIKNKPANNKVKNGLITQKIKQAEPALFTFQDFNDLAVKQNYEELPKLYELVIQEHGSFEIPEGNLNTLGLQLVFNPTTSEQGIDVFQLAIALYPYSANLLDSLAEGYVFIQQKEKAIEYFKKSLELNPQNQNAINRLEQFKE